MSLEPIPTGSIANGNLTLEPGWTIVQNEFGVDVLSCSLIGAKSDVLAKAPKKYDPVVLPGLNLPGFFYNSRRITGGEGLTARAEMEGKGFLSGIPPNPTIECVWPILQCVYTTITFQGPSQCQYTLKFASNVPKRGKGDLGKFAIPFGGDEIPSSFSYNFIQVFGLNKSATFSELNSYFHCVKDDWQKSGTLYEVTQLWQKDYYVSAIT